MPNGGRISPEGKNNLNFLKRQDPRELRTWTTKLLEKSEGEFQTNKLDCNHGKPAVTFNCIRFRFTILFFAIAMFLIKEEGEENRKNW
jgi:hypothetical protein